MRIISTTIALGVLCASAVVAQSPTTVATSAIASVMPACAGTVENIRVSEITLGGSVEKFMAAVAAQKAWYASHHYDDQIFASRILVQNSATKLYSYSETEVLSYHFYSAATVNGEPPHDAGWDAFVKLYKDTSKIKQATLTCVPAANVPMEM